MSYGIYDHSQIFWGWLPKGSVLIWIFMWCVLWAAIAIKKAKCLNILSLIKIPYCFSSRFTVVNVQNLFFNINMLCVECSECDNEGKTSFFVWKLTNSLDPSSPIDISTTVLYFQRLLPSDGEQIFIRTRFSSLNNNLKVS